VGGEKRVGMVKGLGGGGVKGAKEKKKKPGTREQKSSVGERGTAKHEGGDLQKGV